MDGIEMSLCTKCGCSCSSSGGPAEARKSASTLATSSAFGGDAGGIGANALEPKQPQLTGLVIAPTQMHLGQLQTEPAQIAA